MRRLSFNLFLGFALVFSLSACDSGGDDGGDDGNGNGNNPFQANITISGDTVDSYSGFAAFAEDGDGNGGFLIFIFEGEFSLTPTGRILAVGHDTASPSEGTFPIDNEEFYGTYASDIANFTGTFVDGESGQVVISSVSSDEITGSFSFTGELVQGAQVQGEATVSGTFSAERLTPGEIPGGLF